MIFQAFLLSEGLDPTQITIVPRADFTTAPLLSGEADGIDGWVTNELVELTLGGHKVNTLLFSDYGIDLYPNVIFTTEETIAQQPDLVEHVVHALLSGLQSAIDNPETATQTTITYNPDLDAEKELIGMQQSLPLILPAGSHPGTMQPEVWTSMHQTLLDLGLLKTPLDLEASYTLQFLPSTIEAGK